MKKRIKSKSKFELYISAVIFIVVISLSIGFSAFQTELLSNSMSAVVRVKRDVRISDFLINSTENGGTSSGEDYSINNFYANIDLPNSNSSVTFIVKVTNIGNVIAAIDDIINLPEGLTYTLNNYNLNNMLCDDQTPSKCNLGSTTSISITIHYDTDGYDGETTSFALDVGLHFYYLVDAIAMVDNTFYDSLQAAINAVPNNTLKRVTLLQSTSECVEVQKYKEIEFDFGNNTLSNSYNYPVIWNYGTITISNGTITSNAATNGTFNNEDGTVTITGGRFINTGGRQAFYNNGGTATISGSAYFYNTTDQRAAVHNLKNSNTKSVGSLTITSGTIISAGYYGVRNEATMVVGTPGGTPDQTSPVIQGYIDGIFTTTNFAYYDGIIKGRELAINPVSRATPVESGYMVIYGEETIDSQLYRLGYLGTGYTIRFDGNGGTPSESTRNIEANHQIGTLPSATRNGYTFDGWYTEKNNGTLVNSNYTVTSGTTLHAHWIQLDDVAQIGDVKYLTLEAAVATVADNTPTTIKILKDITADITLTSSQYITIDLDGHTISNSGARPIITNGGHLVVENGYFTTSANQAAINATGGTTEITDVSIIASGNNTRQAIYITGGIVTINGSSYLQSQASGKPSGSSMERGTVQVIAGTLYIYDQVEIYASVTNAVSNQGTVIIGDDDGAIDSNYPILRGKMYGIKSTGTVTLYDGILKGETDATYPAPLTTIGTIAPNSTRTTGTDGNYHTYYLVSSP